MRRFLLALLLVLAPITGHTQALVSPLSISAVGFAGGYNSANPTTVANLISSQPCGAAILGQYGVVTDLYSGASNTNEVMRCGLSGSTYYWRPQRTDFAASVTTTGGTATFTCMVNAPTMLTNGTLLSNQTWALSKTNCWPGAQASITNGNTLGIFGLTVTGLVGGLTRTLGLNAQGDFIYDGTDWRSVN